jgi:hypothetical protein
MEILCQNKRKWYGNENIITLTIKLYVIYKAIKSHVFYDFSPENISIRIFFKYLDIFYPFVIDYITFLVFLSIIWFKSKDISKQLLPKIESIILHKLYYNIFHVVIYILTLDFIINIVQLVILLI